MIGSARIDERGKATGGKPGDQNGREVSEQKWYRHKKGWVVIRAKDQMVGDKIADTMAAICKSPLIGYNQNNRNSLWDEIKDDNFDVSKLTKKVDIDCSSGVRVAAAAAGAVASNFTTPTEVSHLLATGKFVLLTDKRYTEQSDYLRKGDILVTKTKGHTGVIKNDGPKAYQDANVELGVRSLSVGKSGKDVTELQTMLATLGFDPHGVDGDYGPLTEKAVAEYQRARNLPDNGKADYAVIKAIKADFAGQDDAEQPEPEVETGIRVTGDSVNLRTGPGTGYDVAGTVKSGAMLTPVSFDGWRAVAVGEAVRWISAEYSEVVD
jgi:hypothetical protein